MCRYSDFTTHGISVRFRAWDIFKDYLSAILDLFNVYFFVLDVVYNFFLFDKNATLTHNVFEAFEVFEVSAHDDCLVQLRVVSKPDTDF